MRCMYLCFVVREFIVFMFRLITLTIIAKSVNNIFENVHLKNVTAARKASSMLVCGYFSILK